MRSNIGWLCSLMCVSCASHAEISAFVMPGIIGGGHFEQQQSGEELAFDHAGEINLIVSYPLDASRDFEFFYARHQSELAYRDAPLPELFNLDTHYLHLGGTSYINSNDRVKTYGVGGLGITHFAPDAGYESETRFSLSFGFGVQYQMSPRFVLRTDAKVYGTLVHDEGGFFCHSGDGCTLVVKGDFIVQYTLGAGIGYRF